MSLMLKRSYKLKFKWYNDVQGSTNQQRLSPTDLRSPKQGIFNNGPKFHPFERPSPGIPDDSFDDELLFYS